MGYSACAPFTAMAFMQVLRFELMANVVCVESATSIREEVRAMKHYDGLDVSVKETAICIVEERGRICRAPRY